MINSKRNYTVSIKSNVLMFKVERVFNAVQNLLHFFWSRRFELNMFYIRRNSRTYAFSNVYQKKADIGFQLYFLIENVEHPE